jgi:vitamin B12 transporter
MSLETERDKIEPSTLQERPYTLAENSTLTKHLKKSDRLVIVIKLFKNNTTVLFYKHKIASQNLNTENSLPMKRNVLKIQPLFIVLMLLFFSCTCWAQSEEEMQLLRMFYKDKDLVVSSTRSEKSISQVAENITVVTAQEIENMNAHSVADVLNTVPGVFIASNQDFVSGSLITIQGSEDRHVLVLVDDIPWNSIAGGNAETSTIPIGAVERIEIIKGPASSAWGSSLGGVVNVITKKTGTDEKPSGDIRGSYGAAKSQDYRGEISGKAGTVGYYLYAGDQTSNGLVSTRSYNGRQIFSKFTMPLPQKSQLSLEIGYSSSKIGLGDFPSYDIYTNAAPRTFYAIGTIKLFLTGNLDLNVTLFDLNNHLPLENAALGLGELGPRGTLFEDLIFDEKRAGARTQLIYTTKTQTAVFGIDYDHGDVTQTNMYGPFIQMAFGLPDKTVFTPDMNEWAVYANDSITSGNWSITPGIRYDHDSNTVSFISPSLGSTYKVSGNTIIRGSVSKGFTFPKLSQLYGGGLFIDPNPDLKPEQIWSYQAGIETSAIPYIWTKISLFHHNLDDIQTASNAGPPTFNKIIVNGGKATRKGFEVEAATVPIYNISLSSGYSYVKIDPTNDSGASKQYTYDAGISYDDGDSIHAQFKGRYVYWGTSKDESKYGDFIWNFNINKKITAYHGVTPELFFTAHNIFSGLQYFSSSQINPDRWLEAGVKFYF